MTAPASPEDAPPRAPAAADYLAFGQVLLNQAAKVAAGGDSYGASEIATGAIPYLLCAIALELGVPSVGNADALTQ